VIGVPGATRLISAAYVAAASSEMGSTATTPASVTTKKAL
jgi:hypothetical protein